MAFYLVERYLPSTTPTEVEAAVGRLAASPDGGARHLWTGLIAAEETGLSLFDATSREAVEAANRAARFPFDRVIEVAVIRGAGRA